MISYKRLAWNIINFAKINYDLSCDWPRTMSLLKRLKYRYVVKAMISIPEKTKFKEGNDFLNYIQKVATDLQLKDTK